MRQPSDLDSLKIDFGEDYGIGIVGGSYCAGRRGDSEHILSADTAGDLREMIEADIKARKEDQ